MLESELSDYESAFDSVREHNTKKRALERELAILELLQLQRRQRAESDDYSEYSEYSDYSDYSEYSEESEEESEKMKVSIVSDPPDKIHGTARLKKEANRGKVHTIKDLPKNDLMAELFGIESSNDDDKEEASYALFDAGRKLQDGSIVYSPNMSMFTFAFPNLTDEQFLVYVIIFLIALVCFILLIRVLKAPPAIKAKAKLNKNNL